MVASTQSRCQCGGGVPVEFSEQRLRAMIAEVVAETLGQQTTRRLAAPSVKADRLTEREREILVLVAAGLARKEIAGRLYLSDETVKNHVAHILEKLEVPNQAAAVAFGVRHGLIPDEEPEID